MTVPGPLCSLPAHCILKVLQLASQTLVSLTQLRRVVLANFISTTRAKQQALRNQSCLEYFRVISVARSRVYRLAFGLRGRIRAWLIAQFQLGWPSFLYSKYFFLLLL